MTVTVKKRKFQQNEDANDVQATVSDFGQRYHCDTCNKDITYVVRIKCATCADFDLCVECFASGAEVRTHKKDHPYRVLEMLDYPIFEPDWGADEELLLVEGLELHGVGNWEQISELIGTKNKQECADHYDRVYVQSPDFPYPAPASQPTNHEIAGFMPGRREFELEFDNEAEQNVKDMEFNEDDSKEEIELKCTMLNIYNTTLARRAERKKFIFDRNLIDFKRIQSIEKKRPKEEKEVFQKMRVFAKMMTAQDFDVYVDGLLNEMRLRQRIAQLQEYRRMGITALRDTAEYDRERVTRVRILIKPPGSTASRISGVSASASPAPGGLSYASRSTSSSVYASGSGGAGAAGALRKSAAPLDIENMDGIDLLSENERHLCSSLRIFPRAYIAIKDTLLKEYAAKGFLKRRQARQLIKIDVNKTGRIFNFFIEMGWISSSGGPGSGTAAGAAGQ
ncbi:hypothetical protein BC831DRAFT_498467 [Entophlyctis helioformis]|nr:hypothetical protein BC831DRAFT_498467 [Entophlyctis helioformis]